ncbi:MAG: glycosyltransferase N-terminal domain-containing protein [Bacteroidota bacterium]
MMLLYDLGIRLYGIGARILAYGQPKARQFVRGRRDWRAQLRKQVDPEHSWVWFHCASLGEFEQGRALIEAWRAQYPEDRILLTFFSPSGYEIRKDYAGADCICYLPLDLRRNAAFFLDRVQPRAAFFIKYELWLNYLTALRARRVPTFLVSAILQPESRFFRSGLKRQYTAAFRGFDWIFTQDAATADLLRQKAGVTRVSVSGDTRFDRAAQLPDKFQPVPGIDEFIAGRRCIVAGSPWPPDEDILLPAIAQLRNPELCWIIAPHEIHPERIDRHLASANGKMVKYSVRESISRETDVLWIDNVGMLSRLYHYSEVVYIGGGLGAGIHNTQEPAVYGNPVIFGPKYDRFREAVDLIENGGAISVTTVAELVHALQHWLDDADTLAQTRARNKAYILAQAGATAQVLTQVEKLI